MSIPLAIKSLWLIDFHHRQLSPELAAGIRRVKGVRRIGVRLGNWLTPEQGRRLLEATTLSGPRELRDQAMVAMLIGCGLRRAELLALQLESIQQREEHWVIADLVGKGGHVRTVPIPTWVKNHVDAWTAVAAITHGPVFRAINKAGRVWGDGMSPKVLWDVVRAAAARAGIDKLAPHDLRRTCARLCHLAGGELDQIPFLLGPRLDSDDRALPRMQAEAPDCSERPIGNRTRRRVTRTTTRADAPLPPWATTQDQPPNVVTTRAEAQEVDQPGPRRVPARVPRGWQRGQEWPPPRSSPAGRIV